MTRFNSTLVKKVKEDQTYREEQEALKKKHHITNKNVVVVEKSNMVKFFVKTIRGLIRTGALLAVTILAFTGMIALVYPEPRQEIWSIYAGAVRELISYLS